MLHPPNPPPLNGSGAGRRKRRRRLWQLTQRVAGLFTPAECRDSPRGSETQIWGGETRQ